MMEAVDSRLLIVRLDSGKLFLKEGFNIYRKQLNLLNLTIKTPGKKI